MNSIEDAILIARELIANRVPWVHQGRNPRIGIDCAGLIVLAYDLSHDCTTYSTHPHNGVLESNLEANFGPALELGDPIQMDDLRVGDVVGMAWSKKGVVRHVGIVGEYLYGGLSLLHTDSSLTMAVEHHIDAEWLSRIKKVFRP